jgi:uncharacterized protein
MTETVITVQGEFSAWYPAERATVSVTIAFDGPERELVFVSARDAADSLRQTVEKLHESGVGPVTWWSSDRLRVWSDRPWNQDGAQLPPVYQASIGFEVKFKDFATLNDWVEDVALRDGASVTSISWDLTEATRTAVTAEVRSRSVKDAVTKATVFAQSIGLGSVTAVALADPGMLGEHVSGGSEPSMRAMKAFDVGSTGGSLDLKPEEIEVSSVVDARFHAR